MDEHKTNPHLKNCVQFEEYLKFYSLRNKDDVNTIVCKDAVTENTKIIDHNNNWPTYNT